MSKYCEIAVSTTTEASELVADIMYTFSNEGVAIYDRKDLDLPNWDYIDECATSIYSSEVVVKGYIKEELSNEVLPLLQARLEQIRQYVNCGSLTIAVNMVDDTAWLETWKKYFSPIVIDKITVCPDWIDIGGDQTGVVRLDSGLAFGTGQHETTSMIIKLMQDIDLVNRHTLDIGCGSGILGIASIKLGANHATLIDMDSQAVSASKHNALLNNCYNKCTVIEGNLVEKINAEFKVIFANLTADILLMLSNDINKVLHSNGYLLLSGILNSRSKEVIDRFAVCKCSLVKKLTEGEWTALLLKAE